MLHSSTPTREIVNANVPLVLNFDVNWNDALISSAVKKYTVNASASRPVLLRSWAEVITAFNAGSGNVLTLGTSTTATELLGSSDITEGTPGFYPTGRFTGALRLVADTDIYAKFAGGAGVQQVETATVTETVEGTLTAGNATVIVTAAGMTGSPKTISVAVATNDSSILVAGKIRTVLAADAAVIALFTVGGTGATVTLTRLIGAANDGTLNINVADGTSSGIVSTASSANTTAGVAAATAGKAKFYLELTPLF